MINKISYGKSHDAWQGFSELLTQIIQANNFSRILDIGGGANPVLSTDILSSKNLDYSILDISKAELNKAPENYKKIVADITAEDLSIVGNFDFIFSKMLVEHIKDSYRLHKNVYSLLRDGGIVIHFFPTLYAFPFLLNKVFPERLNYILLKVFAPRDSYQRAKFPAYYNWCTGPTKTSVRRLEHFGYEVVEYRGLYGHENYYKRIPIVQKIHRSLTEFLVKHPNPYLTSYAYVILKKSNHS